MPFPQSTCTTATWIRRRRPEPEGEAGNYSTVQAIE